MYVQNSTQYAWYNIKIINNKMRMTARLQTHTRLVACKPRHVQPKTNTQNILAHGNRFIQTFGLQK